MKTEEEKKLLAEKWEFLTELEVIGEEGDFVIGQSGVLTEEELYSTLKVRTPCYWAPITWVFWV